MKRYGLVSLALALIAACAAPATPLPSPTAPPTAPTLVPTELRSASPIPAATATSLPRPSVSDTSSSVVLVSLTPDERSLMAWPVDAETLADRSGYPPINLGQHYTAALSPNGRLWAAITWPRSADYDGVLHLIDLITWEDVPTPVKFGKWVPQMAFSPDGSRLVVAEAFLAISSGVSRWDAGLKIINPDALEEVLTVDLDFFPGRIQFSADGRQLTVYGTPPPTRIDPHHLAANPPQVVAFDVLIGSRRWSLALEEVKDGRYSEPTTDDPDRINYYSPGVAFSADGRWLYVVHADEDRLTAVDLAVGSARTVAITEPQSWLDRLIALTAGTAYAKGPRSGAEKWAVLSPDGKRLYVTGVQREWQPKQGKQGDGQVVETPLEMQVIDPHSGERLATAGIASADLAISPDGRWLYLQPWRQANSPGEAFTLPGLQVLDAETLEAVAQLAPDAGYFVMGFIPSKARAYLYSWSTPSVGVLDTSTYQLVATRDNVRWMGKLILLPR